MYLNSNYSYIIEFLTKKKKDIEDLFNSWLHHKKDHYTQMTISPRELNERYNVLNKPFNTYCKTNYIDYNFVVDQILQMSLPYSEAKQNASQDYNKISISEPSVYDSNLKTGLHGHNQMYNNHKNMQNSPVAPMPMNLNQNSLNIYNSINSRPDIDMKIALSNNNFLNSLGPVNNDLYLNPNVIFVKSEAAKNGDSIL